MCVYIIFNLSIELGPRDKPQHNGHQNWTLWFVHSLKYFTLLSKIGLFPFKEDFHILYRMLNGLGLVNKQKDGQTAGNKNGIWYSLYIYIYIYVSISLQEQKYLPIL